MRRVLGLHLPVAVAGLLVASLLSTVTGCGSSTYYLLSAGPFIPRVLSAEGGAQSAITVTPGNGYKGEVSLACAVNGGAQGPMCSFDPNPVVITGTSDVMSTLTVHPTSTTPSGPLEIYVTGVDESNLSPRNQPPSQSIMVKFQHIVIIFQENRTPDNLFHDPVLIARGADIATSGVNSRGETVELQAAPLGQGYDLNHAHYAFVAMCDPNASTGACKMDGADQIGISCFLSTGCPTPNPQFLYVQASDVQSYFDMAEQYTFADRMFQTNQGPSFPAHQFILSGTSEPSIDSPLFVAENPAGYESASTQTGCTAPADEFVRLIDPLGNEDTPTMYPCFEHPTLTDELNSAGLSWSYYAPTPGSIWNAPNAIEHMCGPPHSRSCTAPDWVDNVRLIKPQDPAPVLTDIAASQLRQVSWVIPSGPNSDHAGSPGNTGGPSWVAAVVNAIGKSPYWSNTAIIVTWDDWGGWYDHVPPPIVNDGTSWGSGYVYGFRVPLIVISPFAKAGYISHTAHDFGSILRFVEGTFDLPQLGFADTHANDDLSDCFDFDQPPIQFHTINAPLKADFFLHDTRPPADPDDD